jgi:uncharacterized protein (DUF427 family)
MKTEHTLIPRQAIVDETVIAETPETQTVDGYEYFPPESINWDLLEPSDLTSTCPWKGVATYYDIVIDDRRHRNVAWTYEAPKDAARHIKGQVGFWRDVRVEDAVPFLSTRPPLSGADRDEDQLPSFLSD